MPRVTLAPSTEITLTFVLEEEVTPDFLAQCVAEACAKYYALCPGEGVRLPSDPGKMYLVEDNQ